MSLDSGSHDIVRPAFNQPPSVWNSKGYLQMNRREFIGSALSTPFAVNSTRVEKPSAIQLEPTTHPWNFEVSGFNFAVLDVKRLLFNRDVLTPIRSGDSVDEHGVPILRHEDGSISNNPVSQSQYLLRMLSNFRYSSDQQYLDLALTIGHRLTDSSHMIDGAMYFPYDWEYQLDGVPADFLPAPWYSGMAQGHALQCFTRLWQVTGIENWMKHAHATAESFKKINDPSRPGIMRTNERNELWIEEYPDSSYYETLNGHIFGYFGLYEYWLITQDDLVKQVMDGAMTTVLNAVDQHFRVPGQPSHYAIQQPSQPDGYHVIHTAQILETYRITGDQRFAELAIRLYSDYPPFAVWGDLELQPGTYVVYGEERSKPHLTTSESEPMEIDSPTSIRVHQRRRLRDESEYYYRFLDSNDTPKWIRETDAIRLHGEMTGAVSPFGPLIGTRMEFDPPIQIHVNASVGTGPVTAIALVDGAYHCLIQGSSDWTALDLSPS